MVMTAPPLPFLPPALHGKLVFMGMMAYAGGLDDANRALAPFRALATPLADLVGPTTYSSMFVPEDPSRPAVSIRSRFIDRVGVAEAAVMLEHLDRCDAPMKMAQIRVLGGAAARVPAEATAFAHRQSRILVAFLSMYPETPRHHRRTGPLGEQRHHRHAPERYRRLCELPRRPGR